MKWMKFASLVALFCIVAVGSAHAAADELYRQQSDISKMGHKLGRGVVNILTCWVEVPHNIAVEWEKTDPVSGFIVGTFTGVAWGATRFVTGVYDTVTFPVPVPEGYKPLMEPEFIVTDTWGDPIPSICEFSANDPDYPDNSPIYPQKYVY